MIDPVRFSPALGLCVLLTACGGGGSGDDTPTNAAPTLLAQSFNATEDTALTSSVVGSDPGDTLTFAVATQPAHGTLTAFSAAGAFTYQPASNYNGTDSFAVRVTDSAGQSVGATMTLTVAAVNDAPVATDDALTLTSAGAIDVLANDTDVEAGTLTVSIVGSSFPAGATVDGSGRVTFPVVSGFKGLVRARYRVTDAGGATADATAVGFVDVAPFKAVYLGGGRVHVNDLFSDSFADGSPGTARAERLFVARNGSALVYEEAVPVTGGTSHELFYVDLAAPAVRHAVTGPVPDGTRAVNVLLTADGRQVVHDLASSSGSAIYRYSAASPDTLSQRLSPPDTELQYASGARLNAAGTAVYFGGRAPANGQAAGYRTALASGVTTRVSPLHSASGGMVGLGIDFVWPKPDESLVVTHVLEQIFAPDPHNSVEMNAVATPNTTQLLHIPAPSAISFDAPLMSPDGRYALLFNGYAYVLGRTDAPNTESAIGSFDFAAQTRRPAADDDRAMRADSLGALIVSGCGAPVQFPNVPCDIHEVTFSAPATPARVNAANAAGRNASRPRYSADGARIWFMNSGGGSAATLHVVARGSFGTQATSSAANDDVLSYELDPTGNVALVSADAGGTAGKRLVLVDADAPGDTWTVGAGRDTDGFYLVSR
ncbi:MAG TPA: cadherin-like domain-containing protein [Steroidobacteraceae bacterium]|nr:cadherin-like domain-containing protein [Steroidobacteraceae bacterium]